MPSMQDSREVAKLIVSQFKSIASTICDSELRIKVEISDNMLSIKVLCSADDTAIMIGKGGRTKFAIAQLLETKARKLQFVPRIDLWVVEYKEPVVELNKKPAPAPELATQSR